MTSPFPPRLAAHLGTLVEALDLAYRRHRHTVDPKPGPAAWSWEVRSDGPVQWVLGRPTPIITASQLWIVAVIGTNAVSDWWRMNLRVFGRVGIAGLQGRWHPGFVAAARPLWAELAAEMGADDTVALVGHSAGADTIQALAALFAAHGREHQIEAALAVAPARLTDPTGQRELARFDDRARRVSLEADIVPGLIPPLLYRHAWPLVHRAHDGALGPERAYWRELWHALREPGWQITADHMWPVYARWLRQLAELRLDRPVPEAA